MLSPSQSFRIPLARREESFSISKAPHHPPSTPPSQGGERDRSLATSFHRAQQKHASRNRPSSSVNTNFSPAHGQGLLTRPSSSTDGLSVPGRWRVTWRPRSAEGRLFVDHYLGRSLGSAIEAARRAGYPWTEQMSRKMSRNVEKRGVHAAGNAPSEDRKCWQGVELCIHGLNK